MKDFLGVVLTEGDTVVHGVGGRCGGLDGPYTIHSFTPKMVRLQRKGWKEGEWLKKVPPSNLVKVAGGS